MRGMLRFVGLLGIIVGVLTALALGVLSLQINIVAGKALPEPQSLRLAELVKEGAGENIHVALSDFTAGKPVIIEEKDGVKIVRAGRRKRGRDVVERLRRALWNRKLTTRRLMAMTRGSSR